MLAHSMNISARHTDVSKRHRQTRLNTLSMFDVCTAGMHYDCFTSSCDHIVIAYSQTTNTHTPHADIIVFNNPADDICFIKFRPCCSSGNRIPRTLRNASAAATAHIDTFPSRLRRSNVVSDNIGKVRRHWSSVGHCVGVNALACGRVSTARLTCAVDVSYSCGACYRIDVPRLCVCEHTQCHPYGIVSVGWLHTQYTCLTPQRVPTHVVLDASVMCVCVISARGQTQRRTIAWRTTHCSRCQNRSHFACVVDEHAYMTQLVRRTLGHYSECLISGDNAWTYWIWTYVQYMLAHIGWNCIVGLLHDYICTHKVSGHRERWQLPNIDRTATVIIEAHDVR